MKPIGADLTALHPTSLETAVAPLMRHYNVATSGWLGLIVVLTIGADGVAKAAAVERPASLASQKSGKAAKPRRRSDRPARKLDRRDAPPPCRFETRRPATPPPRSMGDLMGRMMDRFATDPVNGFGNVLDDLGRLEGPALDGVVVSPAEERRRGAQARSEYIEKARTEGYRVLDDRERLAYLHALVDRFARHMTHRDRYPDIGVTIIDAPISDGRSFPGGYVVFTSALLKEPDEATVGGVVAHELAHLDRGHMYDVVRRDTLASDAFRGPIAGAATLDEMFTKQAALFGMLMRPFRPDQEHEADCTAVTWMYLEGYDPHALMGFFESLHRRRSDAPGSPVPFFNFLRSHPYSLDRRDHVQARSRQLQAWKPRGDLGLYPKNLEALRPKGDEGGGK
jgi:beta-barrel assembly-enhancing protease